MGNCHSPEKSVCENELQTCTHEIEETLRTQTKILKDI
jgi:hypothetical protein